jgi:hypothetical protein
MWAPAQADQIVDKVNYLVAVVNDIHGNNDLDPHPPVERG